MNHHPKATLLTMACLLFVCSGSSSGSCASRELHQAELAMQAALQEVLRSLPSEQERRRFRAAHKAWRKERDEITKQVNRTRPWDKEWLKVRVELTRARAEFLRRLLPPRITVRVEPPRGFILQRLVPLPRH